MPSLDFAEPFLKDGFRPFFLLGSIWAVFSLLFWLFTLAAGIGQIGSGIGQIGSMTSLAWHQHEMIFGFSCAIIAGFALTAIPNWTKRLPISGAPLGGLVLVWLVGRIAVLSGEWMGAPLVALLDCAFLFGFAALVLREIIHGRNWRNLPIVILISLLALANLLFHMENQEILATSDLASRLAIGTITMLIGLIGGRIIPSFTRNWLAKQDRQRQVEGLLPTTFNKFDRLCLLLLAVTVIAWVIVPYSVFVSTLLVLAGLCQGVRLVRWCGWRCLGEPLVFILHLGYGWLAVALILLGLGNLADGFDNISGLHALTAGAFATMMLAVMTRATLGHAGQQLKADRATIAIYTAITLGAIARAVSPAFGDPAWLQIAGLLWVLAFFLFALTYGPLLLGTGRKKTA